MNKRSKGYLLDTNAYSDALKAQRNKKPGDTPQKNVARHLNLKHKRRVFIPSVAVQETTRGLAQGHVAADEKKRIESFLKRYQHKDYCSDSARIAGRIEAALGYKNGKYDHDLQNDIQIAAIAVHHDLTLVTNNSSDFARIQTAEPRLRIENWAKTPMPLEIYFSLLQREIMRSGRRAFLFFGGIAAYLAVLNYPALSNNRLDAADQVVGFYTFLAVGIVLFILFAVALIQFQRRRLCRPVHQQAHP